MTATRTTSSTDDLRDGLLDGDLMAIAPELLTDIRAWQDGHLAWTPAPGPAPLTSPTGTIAAVLEGVRDGRLVVVHFDVVVGYEDALAEDAHRSFTRDGDARFPRIITTYTLLARLAEAIHWSNALIKSDEATQRHDALGRILMARRASHDASRCLTPRSAP